MARALEVHGYWTRRDRNRRARRKFIALAERADLAQSMQPDRGPLGAWLG